MDNGEIGSGCFANLKQKDGGDWYRASEEELYAIFTGEAMAEEGGEQDEEYDWGTEMI